MLQYLSPNTPMHAPVLANISPSAPILHLWSLHNEGEVPYELRFVFQPVQSPLKINLTQKIRSITLLTFILLLSEGLGSHTHFQRTFLMDAVTAPLGLKCLKLHIKKESRKNKDIYLLNHVQNLPVPGQEN